MQRYMKAMVAIIACDAVLFLLFWGAMVAVHTVPFAAIETNLHVSARQLSVLHATEYGEPRDHGMLYMPDRGTEVVMMQCVAATRPAPSKESLPAEVSAVMVSFRGAMGNPDALNKAMADDGFSEPIYPYSRYWHGYLVPLRLWLIVADYNTFTLVNMLLLCVVAVWVLWVVAKRLSWKIALIFGAVLLIATPWTIGGCLQFLPCFMIMIVASAVALTWPQLTRTPLRISIFFLNIGALTVYFDFLTTPIITLGFPAAFLMLQQIKDGAEASSLRSLLLMCLAWSVGYFGLWAAKWGLAAAYGADIYQDIIQAVSLRAGGSTGFPKFDALMIPLTVTCIIILIIAVWYLCRKTPHSPTAKSLIIIALLPVLWTLIARNHMLVHYYFTWRSFLLSIFCLGAKYILPILKIRTPIESIKNQ